MGSNFLYCDIVVNVGCERPFLYKEFIMVVLSAEVSLFVKFELKPSPFTKRGWRVNIYAHLLMSSNSSVLLDESSCRAPTSFVILHTIYHALPQIDESGEDQCARFNVPDFCCGITNCCFPS